MLRVLNQCDMQRDDEETTDSKEKAYMDYNNVFGDTWHCWWFAD